MRKNESLIGTGERPVLGWFKAGSPLVAPTDRAAKELLETLDRPLWAVSGPNGWGFFPEKAAQPEPVKPDASALPALAFVAPCLPANLGDRAFCRAHNLEFAYYTGSMANGIASVEMVVAMGEAGMLGFFGAAGLPPEEVEAAITAIQDRLGGRPYGFNLINSLNDPRLEADVVDLYLRRWVNLIEAAAYLDLTLPLVKYRVKGIHRDADGRVVTPQRIIAKVSREEVAAKFFAPPPPGLLEKLLAAGEITSEQVELAREIPMADDLTAEADSGGHTDNRPAITMLPSFQSLRDRVSAEHELKTPTRIGLAGGISTPAAAASAFAMGAAYIVTGSVNQACVESGSSDLVRQMLAETRQADLAMAPAADMFEMGVTVQVLKRGTMFPLRAARLHELYQKHNSLEEIPAPEREKLEKTFFRASLAATWEATRDFFAVRDPEQIRLAEQNPKHKMALIFRSYLGQASHWANRGEPSRRVDYQVWCGPAMGAFNEWARGTFFENPANRKVVAVAENILHGAAVLTRCHQLRSQGISPPPGATRITPRAHTIQEHAS